MNLIKLIFLGAIPCLLLLSSYAGYHYGAAKGIFNPTPNPNMTYQLYTLAKSQHWKDRFDFLQSGEYNSIKRTIVGTRQNFLQVRRGYESYLIEYDTEIDVQLISWVREVRQQGDNFNYNGRYFLVQYEHFVQLVYFDTTDSTTALSTEVQNGTYEAEICLQIPIQANSNARYHIDHQGNIWIVTVSMNKVVFIQIFSCRQRKLIEEFRYVLKNGENVNQISRIVKKDQECMFVQTVTYGLNIVRLQICPYRVEKSITENSDYRRSHRMGYSEVPVHDFGVLQGSSSSIYQEQLSRIVQYIINFLTFSPNSSLLYDRKPSLDENKKQQFDVIAIDEQNNYLINFSKNTTYSGILALNKYLINAKHPLFHNNNNYGKYDVLKLLDREYRKEYNADFEHRYIIPGLNQTKKATYKAVYRTYPDFKVEYLGLTSNVIVFWPQDKLEEKDYTFVRTNQGGLVSQGNKFKGSFDKLPVQYEEVYQRVDAKALEVVPSIFEVHVGYMNLMTYLIRSKDDQDFLRIELLNMLGAKPVLTHYFSVKEGFSYTSTMLLNNQWWVLQYNHKEKRSIATKYQLYANASSPSTILNLKRIYGVIGSEQHQNGEDDLADLMNQFLLQNNNGFILLNIYRCIDEYYYVEYSDASGSIFGVARVHFKNFSNRRIKKSKKYSGNFQRILLLDQKEMIPQRYSRKPYSVYFKNLSIFSHLPAILHKNQGKQAWHRYCESKENGRNFKKFQKIGGFHYFPISHYGIGDYGCNFGSDHSDTQRIFVFNLRNMIISGKQSVQNRSSIRRDIVMKIIIGSVGYAVLAVFIVIALTYSNKKGERVEKEEKEKKKKI